MMSELRIIFMGTSEFSVPSLQLLLENNYNIVAVITVPDKPKGRGKKMSQSPIKELAIQKQIPLLQPTNLKSKDFLNVLKSYHANLQIVVAFRMLPEVVWAMPSLGTFNLHASLLPQYRGSAPINWAIINGEKETGVTTFFLESKIDTGEIIFQDKIPILDIEDAGTLHNKLMILGAELVLKTVRAIDSMECRSTPQLEMRQIKLAPKIFKETCKVNWNQTSIRIKNFVRGLSPSPGAWTSIGGKRYKIFRITKLETKKSTLPIGEWETDNKNYLYFSVQDGLISILELQLEGKRPMKIADFFRGNKL